MEHNVAELNTIAKKIRLNIVKMIGPGTPGHLGGSLSIADIITVLYFYKMKHDPKNPKMKNRDRLLMSKGHSALAQYAALTETGYFPKEELENLKKLGSMLQGHPDMKRVPGLEVNTGSLGQGLSMAAGIAAAGRLDKIDYKVYCVMGDGEMAEGQIWEAAMAACVYKLDNLVGILDRNRLQATGPVAERFDTSPLKEKWESFGWRVLECDGHDIADIIKTLNQSDDIKGQPVLIIANTVKGKGLSFAENVVAFHNGTMSQEQYNQALSELGEQGE